MSKADGLLHWMPPTTLGGGGGVWLLFLHQCVLIGPLDCPRGCHHYPQHGPLFSLVTKAQWVSISKLEKPHSKHSLGHLISNSVLAQYLSEAY